MINNRVMGSALCKHWYGWRRCLFQGQSRLPGAAVNRGANGLSKARFFQVHGWKCLHALAMSSWGRMERKQSRLVPEGGLVLTPGGDTGRKRRISR